MLDGKALAGIPLVPTSQAGPAPHHPWPAPHASAMFLSFDVDAESAWTSKDPAHAERLVTMSYGGFEARVGTPKLLELLDQLGLKATFFITMVGRSASRDVRGGPARRARGGASWLPSPAARPA